MKAPLPSDESKRLEALHRYGQLDTLPEQSFDDLTLLAAHICGTPIALISLVDDSRQWFKARIGLELPETSRDIAFCAHAILNKDSVLEVCDALKDPRFEHNPFVTATPPIRFYAGAPLVAPGGHALGTLCVLDRVPRKLDPDQLAALCALSRQVVSELELRRHAGAVANEILERQKAEAQLQRQLENLAASKREVDHLLVLAKESRRALLSVLEDEQHAGQNLSESEERFRQMAENIHDVFWITDPARSRILYVSPAYEKIWGRSCESVYLSPQSWTEAIHPEDRQRIVERAVAKREQGEYESTYRIVRPDTSVRWIHDRAFPVRDSSGQVYRIIGIAKDITEQRQLEAQLRQAQKMEALGTLSGGIAHDFNNILGAIFGNVHLMKLDLDQGHPASESLEGIEKAAERAKTLVRQILMFSRQQPQSRKVIPLNSVIQEVASLLRSTLPAETEFHVDLDAVAPNVFADEAQVHQILLNLCTNSLHAVGGKRGRIEIQLRDVVLEKDDHAMAPELKRGRYARLSVIDNGHGMDLPTLDRIFEPFFTTKEPGRGTGLGLSVVYGIMQAHDGVIRVISRPGQGTAFQLFFPAVDAEVDPTGTEQRQVVRGDGQRILYLDDEEALVQLAVRALRRMGYAAEGFTHPTPCLEAFTKDPDRYALVITDIDMPTMSGFEFAGNVRSLRPNLPIALTSGWMSEDISARAQGLGIRHLIRKPSTLIDLSESIADILAIRKP